MLGTTTELIAELERMRARAVEIRAELRRRGEVGAEDLSQELRRKVSDDFRHTRGETCGLGVLRKDANPL